MNINTTPLTSKAARGQAIQNDLNLKLILPVPLDDIIDSRDSDGFRQCIEELAMQHPGGFEGDYTHKVVGHLEGNIVLIEVSGKANLSMLEFSKHDSIRKLDHVLVDNFEYGTLLKATLKIIQNTILDSLEHNRAPRKLLPNDLSLKDEDDLPTHKLGDSNRAATKGETAEDLDNAIYGCYLAYAQLNKQAQTEYVSDIKELLSQHVPARIEDETPLIPYLVAETAMGEFPLPELRKILLKTGGASENECHEKLVAALEKAADKKYREDSKFYISLQSDTCREDLKDFFTFLLKELSAGRLTF